MEFENKIYKNIYYSRFAASYHKACYENHVEGYQKDMEAWLQSFTINGEYMDPDTAYTIASMAFNGKLELEVSASNWIKQMREAQK